MASPAPLREAGLGATHLFNTHFALDPDKLLTLRGLESAPAYRPLLDCRPRADFDAGHAWGALSVWPAAGEDWLAALKRAAGHVLNKGPPNRAEVLVYGAPEACDAVEAVLGRGRALFYAPGDVEEFAARFPFLWGADADAGGEPPAWFPSQITEHVFLSGEGPAGHAGALELLGIRRVLNITPDVANPASVPLQLRLPMNDGDGESMREALPAALAFIRDAVAADERVLVHCLKGVSRSATVVASHLMEARGMAPEEALAYLRERRPVVRPLEAFLRLLG